MVIFCRKKGEKKMKVFLETYQSTKKVDLSDIKLTTVDVQLISSMEEKLIISAEVTAFLTESWKISLYKEECHLSLEVLNQSISVEKGLLSDVICEQARMILSDQLTNLFKTYNTIIQQQASVEAVLSAQQNFSLMEELKRVYGVDLCFEKCENELN